MDDDKNLLLNIFVFGIFVVCLLILKGNQDMKVKVSSIEKELKQALKEDVYQVEIIDNYEKGHYHA